MKLATVEIILGEYGRCFVLSRTEPGVKWLVDFFEYRGNGKCDCPQFRFRCQPALEDGASPALYLQCAHIVAAKVAFADHVIHLINKDDARKQKTATEHFKGMFNEKF
jgi:hypothetical protein